MWTQADFNYDNSTDKVDFNLLASNFGQTLPAGTDAASGSLVPQPSSIGLMMLGGAFSEGNVENNVEKRTFPSSPCPTSAPRGHQQRDL